VAARDKLEVFKDVDPGDKVVWQLKVEAQGVEVSVSLRWGCVTVFPWCTWYTYKLNPVDP
jgi:hypothetical protein